LQPEDIVEVSPGVFSAIAHGNSYEIRVWKGEATIHGHRFRLDKAVASRVDAPASILAPMPGKVVRVLAAVGDVVVAGQGIVVVEAMKMQNELKSPRDGRVTAVKTAVGESVNGGTVLALIEP
jgi:biotin carboxyl carrier protein